ncbi:MAG TPA: DUF4899 domain-containing protein [Spirochaetota bacterium]|nr:DUF4899 domain-containing protein [Spirochaetota bacterium]OPZ38292.1 MAG: hypothetical protein BWY96_01116 [Spirochaetes bacterium ADurb.BinA120]HNU91213.1 DUF4899 domain-containing protein [Spirochaetota bacterium]HPI14082.1 DUF4899 domain-containing protein [Spirochaetota bacterium]
MAENRTQGEFLEGGSYLVVKGRFKSQSLNLYGIFFVVFDTEGSIENQNIIVSTFSNAFELEPHVGWERYEENIMELKWKGNFNSSMSSSLIDQLKAVATQPNLNSQLYESASGYDYDRVEIFFSDMLYRIVHDKNLILEIGIQEVTEEEFKAARERRQQAVETPAAQAAKKGYNVEDGSVILPLQPILAPVKGKPLYELKIGDRIMAKIVANSEREKYFIEILNLRVEDHVRPVPCEVIDIKASSKNDPIEILSQIAPGIYGKMVEDERQVKLRMYDPMVDGPISKKTIPVRNPLKEQPTNAAPEGGVSRMTYFIMGLFALLLVIFIILIYLSF